MATRALFSRRSLLFPAAPAAALAALTGCSSSSPSRSEAAGSAAGPASPEAAPAEFIGVFVSRESAAALKARFPARLAAAADEPLFVVLKFHPTAAEREAFAPLMGRRAALQVAGYVEDARTQAVLVRVTTEGGEPIEFGDAAGPQLLALAAADGAAGLNAGAASLLLERLRASDKLRFLLEDDGAAEGEATDATETEWTGELPAFESKLLPLFNPFPAATVTLVRAEDAPALSGTVCSSTAFDPEQDACLAAPAKAECGFCKFMKAGPCGAEFSAWEACLDRCKAGGLDFIDHCGKETLALRDCVDANPEYYHVLHDGEDDAPAAEQQQEQQQQPETAKAK